MFVPLKFHWPPVKLPALVSISGAVFLMMAAGLSSGTRCDAEIFSQHAGVYACQEIINNLNNYILFHIRSFPSNLVILCNNMCTFL